MHIVALNEPAAGRGCWSSNSCQGKFTGQERCIDSCSSIGGKNNSINIISSTSPSDTRTNAVIISVTVRFLSLHVFVSVSECVYTSECVCLGVHACVHALKYEWVFICVGVRGMYVRKFALKLYICVFR